VIRFHFPQVFTMTLRLAIQWEALYQVMIDPSHLALSTRHLLL
jgi:hypothetical protein